MPYKQQIFSFLGDSVTTLEGWVPEGYPSFYTFAEMGYTDIWKPAQTWWGRVLTHFEATLAVNNAWSGSFVCCPPQCVSGSCGCSSTRTAGLHTAAHTPDHILIYMGTNDRGHGFALTSEDKEDLSVFENAYDAMLARVKANYPRARVWCCTLPLTVCTRNKYRTLPRRLYGVDITEHNAVITAVALRHGCAVIDLFDEDTPVDTLDGLHPTADGMYTVAARVIRGMEEMS